MNGTADQRAGAALIVASRRQPENLNVLAALARDSDPWVRAVVANQLTDWIRDDVAADSASALLQRILDSDGTLVARMVAVRLDGSSRTAATDRIAVQLEDHRIGICPDAGSSAQVQGGRLERDDIRESQMSVAAPCEHCAP